MTGTDPWCQLVQAGDGTLYGTTYSEGYGTVFKLNADGSGFGVLKAFTNSTDGAYPHAGLTLSGTTLYGTTQSGGNTGNGTVFKINTDGTGFVVLIHFNFGGSRAGPQAESLSE